MFFYSLGYLLSKQLFITLILMLIKYIATTFNLKIYNLKSYQCLKMDYQ